MKAAKLFCGLLALSVAAPTPAVTALVSQAAASNSSARAPTGRWTVDFADSRCVASRNYGTEAEPLILALKAPVIGEVMQIVIMRAGRGGRYADQLDATIGIDGGAPIQTSMLVMTTGNRRLYRATLPVEQFSAVRRATTLSVRAGGEFRETFQISGMTSLLGVMDRCVADLRTVWNAPSGQTPSPALRQRARGSIRGLFREDDYPGVAIDELVGGSVGVVILINETGRVADCTVTESSGVAALDAQSCTMITERARFEPAIGVDGQPAKDVFHQRVTWRIED